MPSVSHGPNQTEAEKEHDAVRKERLEQKVRRRFGETASIGDCVETVDGRRFDVRGDFDVTLQKIKELESAMGSGCRVMLQKIRGSDGYKMSVELPKTFRKRLSRRAATASSSACRGDNSCNPNAGRPSRHGLPD